jgi:hypothetical protein
VVDALVHVAQQGDLHRQYLLSGPTADEVTAPGASSSGS